MPSNDTSCPSLLNTSSRSSHSSELPRIIIAGCRGYTDYPQFCQWLDALLKPYEAYELVSGCAKGPDTMAIRYCSQDPRCRYIHRMPADWELYGKRAGMIRNAEMAKLGTHLIAFWDLVSHGTKQMIAVATRMKLITTIIGVEVSHE